MFGLRAVLESFVLGFDSITQGGTGLYLDAAVRPQAGVLHAGGARLVLMIATCAWTTRASA
jgi:hypothetical protein